MADPAAIPSAPDRPCPHYPDCVGCPLIGTPYGAQLQRKRELVIAAMAPYSSLSQLEIPAPVGSPRAFGYRNQTKLVVRRTRRGVLLGIFRPGTHQVVDIAQCPVHEPLITHTLRELRRAVEGTGVTIYDERSGEGWLRYAVVRTSAWKRTAQVILVVRDRSEPRERDLVRALREHRGIGSIVLNLNPDRGNVVFGPTFVPLTRDAALIDRVGGLKLRSHAGAFLQANLSVARRMYDQALEWAAPDAHEVAVDLYAGVGAISFYLASRAGRVFGIEESAIAVHDAKANIRLNGFHNVRFFNGEVAVELPRLRAQLDRVDVMTLNPPRKGVELPAREAVVSCAPTRIVYVSCDPQTLARDLDWFAARGYRAVALRPYDLLPQTAHVECVVLLNREGPADSARDQVARALADSL